MINNLFSIKKNNRTISRKYHIIFWLIYFIFNVIRWGSYFDDYWYSIKSNLVEFPLHIILVYTNVYYFIPKFLITKKYKTYVTLLFLALGLLYTIRTGLNYILVTKDIWPETDAYQQAFTFNHIVAVTIGELYVLALATAIKLTIDWVNQKDRIETLRKEHLKSELNFLKSQIQPHFFFNTLNNLYALTLEKSDIAPDVVLKLSDIMQYVIYDVKKSKVNLLNEIEYIQNYADLELLRCHKNAQININLKGNISNAKIPPLVFLSFIENCFKHGNKNNSDFYICIDIEKKENNSLILNIENSFEPTNSFAKKRLKSGIGNSNTKRRLDLIYKDQYSLKIMETKKVFTINLQIPLT
ncbi:sensor histidine kinase [Tenacibaculum ovolyticum]|uniref:sensor histidine kinase n=1 Tax=Tenacibaculum ovolyticum TaxID=104270 RepID=UPI0005B7865C|nr:histidine kinase [Tenacibaculum ovolyticum]